MAKLEKRTLGKTGLEVTRLGFGAMELAPLKAGLTREAAGAVLNAVLDGGITFIDTSPDYGMSEEVIGESISAFQSRAAPENRPWSSAREASQSAASNPECV